VHHRLWFFGSIFPDGRGSLIPARVFSAEPCFLLRFPPADFPRSFSSSIGVPAAEVPCFPLKILDSGQIPVFFLLKAEEGVVFPLVSSDHAAQDLVSHAAGQNGSSCCCSCKGSGQRGNFSVHSSQLACFHHQSRSVPCPVSALGSMLSFPPVRCSERLGATVKDFA
jgi:hypothetical protein